MLKHLDVESQLLYSVARPEVSDAELRALLDRGIHFGRLLLLAQRERATVPLWDRLSRMQDGPLPKDASHLKSMAMVEEFRLLHLRKLLLDVLDLMGARNIDVLLLKGGALAVSTYPRFVDRPMWDLDVLVPPDQAQEAWEVLVEKGWIPAPIAAAEGFYGTHHHHLRPLDDPNGVGCVLEIHKDVLPGESPFAFTADDLWSGSETVEFEGRTVRIPRLSHQVVHLSTHFAWSHMMDSAGWRTFRDLAWIVGTAHVDWDEVVQVAEKARARTCCFWTLRLAQSLVGLSVPDEVLRATEPPGGSWRLDRLERAYALSLTPFTGDGCPSVTLFRFLWRLGIRPSWSGHSGDSPWDIVEHGGAAMGTGVGERSTISDQVKRLPHLVRFASATLRTD